MQNIQIYQITNKDNCFYLRLRVAPGVNRTRQVPHFKEGLLEHIPRLKKHKCYNGRTRSFAKELQNTELAHVLEHIIIELILKYDKNIKSVEGLTSWDWTKNPRYSYEIKIKYSNGQILNMVIGEALGVIDSLIMPVSPLALLGRFDIVKIRNKF